MVAKTCSGSLGHVFPVNSRAGTPCACGSMMRNESERGLVDAGGSALSDFRSRESLQRDLARIAEYVRLCLTEQVGSLAGILAKRDREYAWDKTLLVTGAVRALQSIAIFHPDDTLYKEATIAMRVCHAAELAAARHRAGMD